MFYPYTLTPLSFKLLANSCRHLLGIVLFLTACFTTIAAQTSAYVVRQANDNEVVVIDTSTNLILATFPSGGEGSFRVAANPNGETVYRYLRFSNPVFKNQGQCVKFVNDRIRQSRE